MFDQLPPFYTILTLSFGIIGIVANLILVLAIIFRTPSHMRVYARILAASAACDLVGVVCMMLTVTKEKVFRTACMLEFHGICSAFGTDVCCVIFGVQDYMYTSTSLLLSLSFAFRMNSLDISVNHKHREFVVIVSITVIIVANCPLIGLFYHATTLADPIVGEFRLARGYGPEQAIGVLQNTDLFTVILSNYSILTSVVPFTASVLMRRKTIRKLEEKRASLSATTKSQHDMLVKALNLQLLVSSCFLIGCGLFTFNLVIINLIPDFPETSEIIVPLCNLQNVFTAISNLYVITPYRKSLMCCMRTNSKGSAVQSLNLSQPSN